jgi:membrane associated rhomboid family serine protease
LSRQGESGFIETFGVVPALLTNPSRDVSVIPPALTVLTSMFVHGGFWHLAGNMLYLWIFGNNVEEAMGHVRFGIFYLLCGIAAVAAQVLPNPDSAAPMVGASGAISGVLGAYLLLYPRAKVLLGLPLGFLIIELGRYKAMWVLAIWFLMQLVMGAFAAASNATGGIAFGAHIGGFVAGCLLVTILRRRGVPLWRRY